MNTSPIKEVPLLFLKNLIP